MTREQQEIDSTYHFWKKKTKQNKTKQNNWPFPSSPGPLYHNNVKHLAFDMGIIWKLILKRQVRVATIDFACELSTTNWLKKYLVHVYLNVIHFNIFQFFPSLLLDSVFIFLMFFYSLK